MCDGILAPGLYMRVAPPIPLFDCVTTWEGVLVVQPSSCTRLIAVVPCRAARKLPSAPNGRTSRSSSSDSTKQVRTTTLHARMFDRQVFYAAYHSTTVVCAAYSGRAHLALRFRISVISVDTIYHHLRVARDTLPFASVSSARTSED